MLPKKHRLSLTGNPAFFRQSFCHAEKNFVIYVLDQHTTTPSVGAVTVSKKIAKRAVDRNLVKRKVRESLMTVLPHSSGKKIVVVVRSLQILKNSSSLETKLSEVCPKN